MITAKFGGTAVTPNNLHYIKDALTPFHKAVVVSAVGKEFGSDCKTTDLLQRYYNTHSENVWELICGKYKRLAYVNGIDADVEQLLSDAKSRALKYDIEYCMSLGEELSAKLVSKYLNWNYIEAEDEIIFGKRGLNVKETYSRLHLAFDGGKCGVIGGFYGGSANGRRIFSRGGSDITGSVVAAATNSSLYENWTDVYGVCVANPNKIDNVTTLPYLSYSEMELLSRGGAEVLHPDAVRPVQKKGIPIRIANFYNPFGPDTVVCNCSSRSKLLALTEKEVDKNIITTVLHNCSQSEINGVLEAVFNRNRYEITVLGRNYTSTDIAISKIILERNILRIVSNRSVAKILYECFNAFLR